MKELLGKVTNIVADTKDNMLESIETNFSIERLSEKFTSLTESVGEKSAAFTSDLIALSPIIEEIGFKTAGITLSIGIPPSATFHFEKFQDISAERRDQILEQHKDKTMLKVIVKTLLAADNFQSKVQMGNFRFGCIEVSVGLTPGVNVQLIPKG